MSKSILPIFPLPNIVFFPKNFLPLRIFEPQYKRMIVDVLEKDRKVGIILLDRNAQKGKRDYQNTRSSLHRIGCIGKIETCEKLPGGRFNILLRGLYRFEVLEIVKNQPYQMALVKHLEDTPFQLGDSNELKARDALLEKSVEYFHNVLRVEMKNGRLGQQASLERVVNEIAAVLDIPVNEKQELLEIKQLKERLNSVSQIVSTSLSHAEKLRRIIKFMKYIPLDPELN